MRLPSKVAALKQYKRGCTQSLIWLLLMLGLCTLPRVAGSQNAQTASAVRANPWLQRYQQAMDFYHAGQYAKAYARFHELADFGSAGAQTMLGHMHLTGKGVPQSAGKSFIWFYRAAERGYAPAQLALGRAYVQGQGVKRNKIRGALWFSLVTARGTPSLRASAQAELDRIIPGFSVADRGALDKLKRDWRPDIALMP